MESRVKQENFIVVQGWMISELQLKGNELLVYAIIYGFSQAENQVFTGSLQYLADWTNSTKNGVVKCLKSLAVKGYIEKLDKVINGVKFCEYYATKLYTLSNKVVYPMQQSCMGGMQQSLPNNISINNKEDNIENIIGKNRFTKPTIEEVQAYCQERNNNVDAQRWFDYYSSNGWKVGKNPMKDWKAAVRTWERSADNVRTNQRVKDTTEYGYPDEC